MAVASFEQGVSGYTGTHDTVLYSIDPDVNFGVEASISPDQQDANGVRQGLMKFEGIFGNGAGQIPLGSTITSATLEFNVVNSSFSQMQMSFYRMLTPWTESSATWNGFGQIGGVQASEGEVADLPPDFVQFDPTTGTKVFDVTKSLQFWSAGQDNQGWLIESSSSDGWDFETSEAAIGDRPKLTVTFTAPAGNGTIGFLDTAPRIAEGHSGTQIVSIPVSRLGGTTGAVSANYTITLGTAEAGDIGGSLSGTVNYAAGSAANDFIDVVINGDTALEGNETITITLSAPTGGAALGTSVATLTIADDDALINEALINVSDDPNSPLGPFDETEREYIELVGTPGAMLDDYYFVIFDGDEEQDGGTAAGKADLVVNLSGVSFGDNGLLVLTPTNWEYLDRLHEDSERLIVAALDGAGGGLEDSSQTLALVYSPNGAVVQGVDYDVDVYESSSNSALGPGVGIIDHSLFLVDGAQFVDSVAINVSGTNRDRAIVTPELGSPGVHIHQPTGAANSNNLASDAMSRLHNNFLPNARGAWFNGDILDTRIDNDPIEYLNGTTRISVVAPDGSVLTPGNENILRNVFVTADADSFDETSGMATFTVTRTGDTSQEIDVTFTTVDGLAHEGSDFDEPVQTTLHFGVGVSSLPIEVTLTDDGIPEGFEEFSVVLTSAPSPFLIVGGGATVTINDADVEVATFQEDIDGYSDTTDTYIDGNNPTTAFPFDEVLIVDDQVGEGEPLDPTGSNVRAQQVLIKFEELFGSGAGQVPEGAQIFGGFITVKVLSPSSPAANIKAFRMLQNWNQFATWADANGSVAGGDTIINGVTPDDIEASAVPDGQVALPDLPGLVKIPISSDTLQAWANGTTDNFGWLLVSDSADSWTIASSEDGSPPLTFFSPQLTILYTNPSGAGSFQLASPNFTVEEEGVATIIVERVGGSTGAASINYDVTAGTGSLGDLSGTLSGTLNFADGELFKTFNVATSADAAIETNETFNITLSGGSVSPVNGTATLTVRDNDISVLSPPVVMSEVLFNQPGNDGGSEILEIVGTPGTDLGSLYLVVIGGDIGSDEGATNLVVDLGAYELGSNGTLLVGAQNSMEDDFFNYNVPTGTTYIGLEELNAEFVGGNDNGTSTYALIYSPDTPLHVGRFDYDWDNDEDLELPAGAVIIDSIGVKDNSSTDVTYGGSPTNTLVTTVGQGFDGVSRLPGTTGLNNAAHWYGGDILGSNDALVYNSEFSTALPVAGVAITPGEVNTGASATLVTVGTVTTTGQVKVNFSGSISQVLVGDGTPTGEIGAGISITDTSDVAVPGIDLLPTVSGFGTNQLTLSFTGPGTIGGRLPSGTYHLNFVGNSLVGNGRAVDANNVGMTSNKSVTIVVNNTADFNNDGEVSGLDFLAWQRNVPKAAPTAVKADGDADNDTDVDGFDLAFWEAQYGTSGTPLVAAVTGDEGTISALAATYEAPAPASSVAAFELSVDNFWLPISTASDGESDAAVVEDEYLSDLAFEDAGSALAPLSLSTAEGNDDLFDSLFTDDDEDSIDDAFAEWVGVAVAV